MLTHKKIYFLHHDSAGLLSDRAYAHPPSAEEIERVRAELATIHGEMHPHFENHPRHKGEKYAVHVVPATLVIDGVTPMEDCVAPKSLAGDRVHLGGPVAKAAPLDGVEYQGVGRVIMPGDPNHPNPEFRGTPRETMVMTAADIGVLDAETIDIVVEEMPKPAA